MIVKNLRRLAWQSALYTVSNIVVRGANYALIPVYVQLLPPADYGLLGIFAAMTNLASMGLMFGLYAAAARLYFDYPDVADRRKLYGSLWWFLAIVPLLILMLVDLIGPRISAAVLRQVPYDPYIRLALWSAYLSNFSLLPTTLLRNQEKPGKVLALSCAAALISVGSVVILVVVYGQGVEGVVVASVVSNLAMAVVYSLVMAGEVGFGWTPSMLWAALRYSLPFWPHALAGWLLNLSDRVVLERFVSLAQVGLYSLGYQIGQALAVVIEAGNQAWAPFFFRSQTEQTHASFVPQTATYFVGVASGLCLAAALLTRPALRLVTPAAYWGAEPAAVIIVLGFLALAPYYVWANTVMYSKKVAGFPLVTIAAGTANIVLNILLVPRWGMVAAAVDTAVCYAALAGMNYWLALRTYRVEQEYRRWLKAIGLAAAVGVAGQWIRADNVWAEAAMRAALVAAWAGLLLAVGFLNKADREQLLRLRVRVKG